MKSIQQQLAEARIGIENALAHPEIQQQLPLVGYNKKKLLEGKALYDHSVDLIRYQIFLNLSIYQQQMD